MNGYIKGNPTDTYWRSPIVYDLSNFPKTSIEAELPTLKNMSEEERLAWENKISKKLDISKASEAQKEQIYRDQKYIEKFGIDAFNSTPNALKRNKQYLDNLKYEYDSTIHTIYKNDPRLGDFLNLDLKYKKRLLDEKIMPLTLEQILTIQDDLQVISAVNSPWGAAYMSGVSVNDDKAKANAELSKEFHVHLLVNGVDPKKQTLSERVEWVDKTFKIGDREVTVVSPPIYDPTRDVGIGGSYKISLTPDEENFKAAQSILSNARTEEYRKEQRKHRAELLESFSSMSESDKIDFIDDLVDQVGSRYNRVYGDSYELSREQKLEAFERYERDVYSMGESAAFNNFVVHLDDSLQDIIAEDQGFLETAGKAVSNFTVSLAADFALTFNTARAKLTMDDDEFAEWATTGQGAYLQDVAQAGSFDIETVNLYRETGLSKNIPVWTREQERDWTSAKTFYDVAQQSKWLVEMATMDALTLGTGKLLGAGLNVGTKALKTASIANRGYSASKKIIKGIDYTTDALKFTGSKIKYLADALPIAAQEGISSAREVYDYALANFENEADKYAKQMIRDASHNFTEFLNFRDAILAQNPDLSDIQIQSLYNKTLYDNYVEEYKINNRDRFEESKNSAVNASFKTTFALSTIKTAVTNTAFRNWMYKRSPTYIYGNKELSSRMALNASGKLETVPMTKYQKYIKPFIHNPLTEGADEFSDVMISSFGTGVGNEVYNKHYTGNYGNDFNTYMSYIYSGIMADKEALYEESTWREAWMGALSGGIGLTPNLRGIVGVFKGKKENGVEYTRLERISNIITNPILNDIASNQRQELEAQRVVDIYNKALDKHQNTYQSLASVSNAMAELEKAQKSLTHDKIEDAEREVAFSMMSLLNELESDGIVQDSKIVSDSLAMLKSAASGQISDEEAQEYINSVDNGGNNISIEQAKEQIQKNASDLLEAREKISTIKKQLGSIPSFNNLPKQLQNLAIHHEYNISAWNEEVKTLSSNLGITSKDHGDPIILSEKDAIEQERSYSDVIDTLTKKLEEVENSTEKDKKKKRYNKLLEKELQSSRAVLFKKLFRLKDKAKSIIKEDGYAETITAEQMSSLDAASLSYLLDENNKNLMSKEQQNEIEIFKHDRNLTNEDIQSIHRLKNLQQSIKISEKAQKILLSNPEAIYSHSNVSNLSNDLLAVKDNKRRMFSLFDSRLRDFDGNRILTKEQILKEFFDYDSDLIKEYIEERKDKLDKEEIEALNKIINNQSIMSEINDLLYNLNYSYNDKLELYNFILDVLTTHDINSSKELYKKIKEEAKNYKETLNKSVLESFIDLITKVEDNNSVKEKIDTPIVPDSSGSQSATPKSVEPKVKLTPEEEKKIASEVPKVKPEDMQRGDTNPNAENELITFALNLASKGINGYNKETRDRVVGIINNASLYCTKEELSEYLLAEANRLDSQSSDENDLYASSLLRQCASKVANRKDSTESPQEGERRETLNVFERNNSRASNMESLNMDQIVRDYPNSPNAKFYEKYKVREFLESNQISNRTPVVFISDPSFVEEVEESMRSNGANPTVYSLPLIAAVEVESGGIEIDGKHYQPIALMPSTDSQTKRGAARLGDVRTRAYKQKDSGKVELVKDEDGDVITTTIYGNINAEPPTQINSELPNKSAHTLLINDASESDRRELQNLSKVDRRRSPVYQRIKAAFLSKLSHRKTKKGEELVYKGPNLKRHTGESEFEEIPIIALLTPSHKTVDRNSDRLIVDLLKEGNKAALYSNSRIIRYTKALNKFFSETFNTSEFSFEQDENGNVTPTESTIKYLREYAAQLDSKLGNFLNLPLREGWKYQIESTGRIVDGKIEYKLSIQDSYGNTIDLATLTEGRVSEDTQLEIIRNLMIDSNTGEARMRNNRDGFVIWNVLFADAGSSSEGAKNNMADIFDDDIIEFSKESLKYTIKGVTINAPFSSLGEPLYKRGNQGTSVNNTNNTNTENVGGDGVVDTPIESNDVSDIVDSVSDANTPSVETDPDTGAVIGGNVQTESTQEQTAEVESKPVEAHIPGKVRNRFEDSLDSKTPTKTVSPKYQWGVFEGAKMSVDEITDALIDQDIYTEEDWNNLSEQEKDRVLKCCGAL